MIDLNLDVLGILLIDLKVLVKLCRYFISICLYVFLLGGGMFSIRLYFEMNVELIV